MRVAALVVAAACVLGAGSQAAEDGAQVQAQARGSAAQLAARIRLLADNVTRAAVLQDVIDGRRGAVGAQVRAYSIPASLLREQAGLAADGLVAAAPSLLRLRDAAAAAERARRQAEAPSASAAAEAGGTLQDIGVDADQLRQTGVLREAALDADIKALDPAAVPPAGSFWSPFLSKGPVNLAGSAVTLPQYCLRVGTPSFGSAYSSPSQRDDVAAAILGGMAPGDDGKYPCVTRNSNLEQQSLDASNPIYCLTRLNVRVVTCGSRAEMLGVAQFLNVSAALEERMRSLLQSPAVAGLLWQRIAYAHMGVERSFPAAVWREARLDPHERYDPRLQPWFWAAASAPRALVMVLDTGAAMEEFDRRTIALRIVSGVLRSLGPADIVALVAARDGAPRVFGCGVAGSQCGAPLQNASGLRLCASKNETVEWMLAGAAASFLDSTYGVCDLGQGVQLALQLIQGEIDAWPTGSAVQVGLPRAEVLVVASARGWAPPDSVRKSAEDANVAVHAVSVGAVESGYERGWLQRLACGAAGADGIGALSHIPYRYIWQQTVGGWYRLATRRYSKDERIVAVSALRLSGHAGVPVITLSAPFHQDESQPSGSSVVAGVVAMDVAPGAVFAQLALNVSAHLRARMAAAEQAAAWWAHSQQQALVEMWAVDSSSGRVLAHPSLPVHLSGFTHLRDLEGADVYALLAREWQLDAGACAGPVLFTNRPVHQSAGFWRLGRPMQRAAYMVKLGDTVEHLDAVLIMVYGGDEPRLSLLARDSSDASLRDSGDACQPLQGQSAQGLVVTSAQPGFPLNQRNASALMHHYELKDRPPRVATTPGSQVGQALYGSLGNITLSGSVYAVSSRGLKERSNPPSATDPGLIPSSAASADKTRAALDELQDWLLEVNLTSTGRMYPAAPAGLSGGGPAERAVRDVLATSALDAAWQEAWAVRQRLQDSGVLTSLLALWRFVSVATAGGVLRVFPGHLLPDHLDWTTSESYIRSLEGAGGADAAIVAGPYAHPADGTRTVSIGSVVWEEGSGRSVPMGVATVEFAYTGFVLGALDTLDACVFAPNERWCMLLDQHAFVVGVSSSKLTGARADSGVFLGEVEPGLLGALHALGAFELVQMAVRPGGGVKGRMVSGAELRVNATGVVLEGITSWDGVQCLEAVTFALQPVAGTNSILVVAANTQKSIATPCSQIVPVTRAALIERLEAAAGKARGAAPSPQCGTTRSSPCASCYLSVPVGTSDAPLTAGARVVGADASQWVRETRAGEAGGGGSDCVMPTTTLVRAHDGGAGDASACVWWRRRAGWC